MSVIKPSLRRRVSGLRLAIESRCTVPHWQMPLSRLVSTVHVLRDQHSLPFIIQCSLSAQARINKIEAARTGDKPQ
eukprot:474375-Rhodomonas_salina.1